MLRHENDELACAWVEQLLVDKGTVDSAGHYIASTVASALATHGLQSELRPANTSLRAPLCRLIEVSLAGILTGTAITTH